MGTVDLSRAAFDPEKRYAGVRMQQGRVTVDDDYNEGARIEEDDDQRALVHIIGPAGSPDDGFRAANPRLSGGGLDFDLLAGTMYLGGLRVWNPSPVAFSLQPDWLLQPTSERALPPDGQMDLLYLEAWQQPVTAVEDAELFEAALAGPDTAARLRTMWRVRRAQDVDGTDCPGAWAALVASWAAAGLGTVAPNAERVVDTRLTVGLDPGGVGGDLCSPPIGGGYLGAENQAIRVELVDASHFTWGFDNAAPLYRVVVGADSVTITLETEPKDQAHWPLAGQIVEILPWSAVLPNGEKLAELSGHLSRVSASYDPDLRTLTLTTALPAGFAQEWLARADAATLVPNPPDDRHLYLRVWNRGDDTTSAPAIPFTTGTPVGLGSTGLTVTITGGDRVPTDHWIIAARPETPEELVPWNFQSGRAPHGVRRFYTPLALVRWRGGRAGLSWELLHDCRRFFPPLTRPSTCCTVTVGDEQESFGRFRSIQDAVDSLPPEGGKVCVLPGTYREQVTIRDRRGVTIEGCGRRSRLVAPERRDACGVLISRSQEITLRGLAIESGLRPGVVVFDGKGPTPFAGAGPAFPPGAAPNEGGEARRRPSQRIHLEELSLTALALPAVAAFGPRVFTLRDSVVRHGPLPRPIGDDDLGRFPAVFLLADDVLVESNEISAPREPAGREAPTFTRTAMGGLQIGGGSERVEVRRNRIDGGNGDGVTLGSWAWAPRPTLGRPWTELVGSLIPAPAGFGIIINDDGCIEVVWDPPPPRNPDGGDPLVPVSMGDLYDIRIVDNAITNMGRAGVGVARFFDLGGADELIRVERLFIETNRIVECLRLPIPELPERMRDVAGQGAITLADGEIVVIRDNVIERNGRSHIDPVCGVFALRAAGLSIERNRIVDNAPRTVSRDPARGGFRGGVVVLSAQPPIVDVQIGERRGRMASGVPAARVVGNVIVVPEGRCVLLVGVGTMTISDNQLTSRGIGTAAIGAATGGGGFGGALDMLGGAAVFVLDVGRSNELGQQLATWQTIADVEVEPGAGLDAGPPLLTGGDVLFADNQVSLNLLEGRPVDVLSSVALLSFDDISASANQLQCEQAGDRVAAQLLGFGWSFRLVDNRLEESLLGANGGVTNGLSAFVYAPIATATSNQSTHCLLIVGLLRVFADNIQLAGAFDDAGCGGATGAAGALGSKYMKR